MKSNRFSVLSTDRVPFTGHRIGSLAAAVQAVLRFGDAPMTEEDIIRNTKVIANELGTVDQPRTVRSHLRFWYHLDRDPDRKQRVYEQTPSGWVINPNAVYSPEWENATEEDAKRSYDSRIDAR